MQIKQTSMAYRRRGDKLSLDLNPAGGLPFLRSFLLCPPPFPISKYATALARWLPL